MWRSWLSHDTFLPLLMQERSHGWRLCSHGADFGQPCEGNLIPPPTRPHPTIAQIAVQPWAPVLSGTLWCEFVMDVTIQITKPHSGGGRISTWVSNFTLLPPSPVPSWADVQTGSLITSAQRDALCQVQCVGWRGACDCWGWCCIPGQLEYRDALEPVAFRTLAHTALSCPAHIL